MSVSERSMGLGLRALRRVAGTELIDRLGARAPTERLLYRATRNGFRAAGTAARTFKGARRNGSPARLRPAGDTGVFDLTPTDEQQMLKESVGAFAQERLRPAAPAADVDCAPPADVLKQAGELGLAMLGVPEELGGVSSERSTVTSVLVAEALAQGDMGLAAAALAPASVASALGLWGDDEQQATYLPALVGDEAPAAAIALQERAALFDPQSLRTTARRDGGDYLLAGAKVLVPRAAEASLLLVAATVADAGPALFIVEAASAGVLTKTAPAMGVRAAGTGEVRLEDVRVPATALLAAGDPDVYRECVRRARLAWCALALGTARAVLDYVIPYVNERQAFGEPISHRQAVAFAVSDLAVELEGMRLTTLRAAARADAGKDFAREVALARSLCVEKGSRIGSEGVQLLGGHGYVTEHPVERWYRDL
ncbi:MAG TPA: acyl-CoA dehydrogenase family protein, partial [Solirubrobacteraceae bacterium]|nr:acyl-CoA dehydrogenase family protein [Solirubrobacteraceae bacterium]